MYVVIVRMMPGTETQQAQLNVAHGFDDGDGNLNPAGSGPLEVLAALEAARVAVMSQHSIGRPRPKVVPANGALPPLRFKP